MSRYRALVRLAVAIAALAILPWPGSVASAQSQKKQDLSSRTVTVTDAAGRKHTRVKPFTQAERQAAADRLKAKRLEAAKAAKLAAALNPSLTGTAAFAAALAMGPLPANMLIVGPNGQLFPDYSGSTPNWAFSPAPTFQMTQQIDPVTLLPVFDPITGLPVMIPVIDPVTGLPVAASGGLRKFVDTLPGLNAPNNLNQMIPIAIPDTTTYACGNMVPLPPNCKDADYYEIELGEYSQKLHSDLPATRLRGYRQTNMGGTPFSYLGPLIVAQKDRPVRIKFTNSLPTGAGGNLYLPVDATIMGAGTGPTNTDFATTADLLCKKDPVSGIIPAICYTENRADLHLHGGVTPWISDGTPHQWITPTGEITAFKEGVSAYNVPDMPFPGKFGDPTIPGTTNPSGAGSQTYYYTNNQSARLMFYHDHASGITRLNVYIGEAAGYLLQDAVEQSLVYNPSTNPGGVIPSEQIPLVLQDKTFVDAATVRTTDPTWNWGTGTTFTSYTDKKGVTVQMRDPVTGDLWWPHVYMPAQNPFDITGTNAMGRWPYGPWFWPPTAVPHGTIPNPYYDCNSQGLPDVGLPCTMPWQPMEVPGTPNPSWGAEAFMDTPLVNGTAYPTLSVEPKAYRFRILNAAHDRFFNLGLYQAVSNTGPSIATMPGPPVACIAPTDCTEVRMVPASPGTFPANPTWPTDGRVGGVPDPTLVGPDFLYIGTEGGFLPMPVHVPNQPITYNMNPTTFNFGNVDLHGLLLGPAERADVIIDFSAYAGKTLIVYNDAPAPFPALFAVNDYYTGAPDNTATGGAPTPLGGYGPNTRTIMQIVVGSIVTTPEPSPTLASLTAAWAPVTAPNPANPTGPPMVVTPGVFERSQDPIIVGQTAYNNAYAWTFPAFYPAWGIARIQDSSMTIETVPKTDPVTGVRSAPRVLLPFQPKAIHDEMGATFDDYGRSSAKLGLELPAPTALQANFVMQGFNDPATELIKLSQIGTPIGDPLADGTQIWKITHNGVDTHPVHFHLFNVQLVNRVGWDGMLRLPHPTELGWKDTVRTSPLEDTIVALRPIAPRPETLPWELPNSIRPLNPSLPIGSSVGFSNLDPQGNAITVFNDVANFGWEYVWHCHILSHEENDMMRAVVFAAPPAHAPTNLAFAMTGNNKSRSAVLTWSPVTALNLSGYTLQRSTDPAFAVNVVTTTLGMVTTYTDPIGSDVTPYFYRVAAANTVGSAVPGFPMITANSGYSNVVNVNPVLAPTLLKAVLTSLGQVSVTFTDNAVNETSFLLERSQDGGLTYPWSQVLAPRASTGLVSFTDASVLRGFTYTYRVKAISGLVSSGYSNLAPVLVDLPAAPSNPTFTLAPRNATTQTVTVRWTDNSNNEFNFIVQRATNATFTLNVVNTTVTANTTSLAQIVNRATTYYYRVQATNFFGASAWTPALTVAVP